jgi:hypothetical protein
MGASSPRSQPRRWAQIARFGVALDGHFGNEVAEHKADILPGRL